MNITRSNQAQAEQRNTVLQSRLAGQWYTADENELRQELQGYLDEFDGEVLPRVRALILPHAGYAYSGQVAAAGIRQLVDNGDQYRRVIILGPSHRMPMQDFCSIPDVSAYSTPLGKIPLDTDFIKQLKQSQYFQSVNAAHQGEHSVQIEMPMLQYALKNDFELVPIVVGQLSVPVARAIGQTLAQMVDEHTLVVVSTDFTHYGPRFGYQPFDEKVPEQVKELDLGAYKYIEQHDLQGFTDYINRTDATICGRCPVMVLLAMLDDSAEVVRLDYNTSGNLTGDWENFVSYLAAAVKGYWPEKTASPGEKAAKETEQGPADMSAQSKENLLNLARRTIEYYLANRKMPTLADLGIEVTEELRRVMGAFVTLHKDGQLRGCIGEIFPSRPLYEAVLAQAVNAAVNDHRFRPVSAAELSEIEIEISALTKPEPVDGWQDIELGRHGMVLSKGARRAVFLPQVAPEQGWDLPTTLTHLAMKAGLPAEAWREGASFTVFEAIVFHEGE